MITKHTRENTDFYYVEKSVNHDPIEQMKAPRGVVKSRSKDTDYARYFLPHPHRL